MSKLKYTNSEDLQEINKLARELNKWLITKEIKTCYIIPALMLIVLNVSKEGAISLKDFSLILEEWEKEYKEKWITL